MKFHPNRREHAICEGDFEIVEAFSGISTWGRGGLEPHPHHKIHVGYPQRIPRTQSTLCVGEM